MTSKYLFYPFTGQYENDNSFNVALINCCVYKQIEVPLLINVDKNKEEYLKKLNLKNGNNLNKLFQYGGIVIINHPLLNINTYVLINSFMGPRILSGISKERIENTFNIVDGYYFSK